MFKQLFRLSLVMLLLLQAIPVSAMHSRPGSAQAPSWWNWKSFAAGAVVASGFALLWSKKNVAGKVMAAQAPRNNDDVEIKRCFPRSVDSVFLNNKEGGYLAYLALNDIDPRSHVGFSGLDMHQVSSSRTFSALQVEYEALNAMARGVFTETDEREAYITQALEQFGKIGDRRYKQHATKALDSLRSKNYGMVIHSLEQAKSTSTRSHKMLFCGMLQKYNPTQYSYIFNSSANA